MQSPQSELTPRRLTLVNIISPSLFIVNSECRGFWLVLILRIGHEDWVFLVYRDTYALSFYGSKFILDHPNHFGQAPIVLDESNSFWSGPNHFGQIQIIKIIPEKSILNLTKMIWTQPKQFGPDHNNLYLSKTIWMVKNHFEPIEGQGIIQLKLVNQTGFKPGTFQMPSLLAFSIPQMRHIQVGVDFKSCLPS